MSVVTQAGRRQGSTLNCLKSARGKRTFQAKAIHSLMDIGLALLPPLVLSLAPVTTPCQVTLSESLASCRGITEWVCRVDYVTMGKSDD